MDTHLLLIYALATTLAVLYVARARKLSRWRRAARRWYKRARTKPPAPSTADSPMSAETERSRQAIERDLDESEWLFRELRDQGVFDPVSPDGMDRGATQPPVASSRRAGAASHARRAVPTAAFSTDSFVAGGSPNHPHNPTQRPLNLAGTPALHATLMSMAAAHISLKSESARMRRRTRHALTRAQLTVLRERSRRLRHEAASRRALAIARSAVSALNDRQLTS